MIRGTTLSLGLAALLTLAAMPAHAVSQTPATDAEEVDPSAPAADDRWALELGVQGDRNSAYGFTSRLGYDLWRHTTVHGSAHATQYQGDLSQTNPGSTRSLAASVGATQRFGRFALDGDVGQWRVTNLATTNELKVSGAFSGGAFSGALRSGYRKTKFNNFATIATIDQGAGPQNVAVTAACELKSTAFGADGRYQGRRWGLHGSLTQYNYSDATCALYPAAGGAGVAASENAAQFAALAPFQVSRLQNLAMPVIGGQQSLAKSSAQVGISFRRKDAQLALDYLRSQDYYTSALSKAYFSTLTADLGGGTAVEVTFGDSRGGGTPRGIFGGLGVRARF